MTIPFLPSSATSIGDRLATQAVRDIPPCCVLIAGGYSVDQGEYDVVAADHGDAAFGARIDQEVQSRPITPRAHSRTSDAILIGATFYGVFFVGVALLARCLRSDVLCGIVSSPFGLTNSFTIALLGTPIVWIVAGSLVAGAQSRTRRILLLILMGVHYGSIAFILKEPTVFDD
ncbi:MAG: hypothetical protein L0Y44_06125 [Phycisphaerales bacterium]|nr:hypothetical protein [Phycisphaerales bacterium]